MGTDCIGSCKSNYHAITKTTAPIANKLIVQTSLLLNFLIELLLCITSTSRKLNTLCKVIALFMITFLTQLYAKFGILLACGKYLRDCIIFTKSVCFRPWSLFSPAICYWSPCTNSEQWAVMYLYRCCLFLRCVYCSLELIRQCGISFISFNYNFYV